MSWTASRPRHSGSEPTWRPTGHAMATAHDVFADDDRHEDAQAPWGYRAFAHDYRPDLARFVSAVFALPASDEQMSRIESALAERDRTGEQLFGSWSVSQPAHGSARKET